MNLYLCRYQGIDFGAIALVSAASETDALRSLAKATAGSGCVVTDQSTAELVNLPENESLVIWDGAY